MSDKNILKKLLIKKKGSVHTNIFSGVKNRPDGVFLTLQDGLKVTIVDNGILVRGEIEVRDEDSDGALEEYKRLQAEAQHMAYVKGLSQTDSVESAYKVSNSPLNDDEISL